MWPELQGMGVGAVVAAIALTFAACTRPSNRMFAAMVGPLLLAVSAAVPSALWLG